MTLNKEIIKKTRLRNNFLKDRTEENLKKYSKQKDRCVSLLKRTKQNFFHSLNKKDFADSRKFWQTLKPKVSNKTITNAKIISVKNEKSYLSKTHLIEPDN